MKTKLSTLFAISLLLSACGERSHNDSAKSSGNDGSPRDNRGSILLTTNLPPEHLEGTPHPVILPL